MVQCANVLANIVGFASFVKYRIAGNFCRRKVSRIGGFHRLFTGAANCSAEGHNASKLVEKTIHQYRIARNLAESFVLAVWCSVTALVNSAKMLIVKPLKVTLQATHNLKSMQ